MCRSSFGSIFEKSVAIVVLTYIDCMQTLFSSLRLFSMCARGVYLPDKRTLNTDIPRLSWRHSGGRTFDRGPVLYT